MKFGIFTIVPYHEDFTQQQALNDALEQIEYADRLGIEEVWLGEHRFSRHGLLSGIWSFLGAVAGRTKNMRIGTAVIVLPLHNPVLVAEEVAMLDVISGGRINFGIGAGYQQQEFDGVGVDIDTSRERFQEAVDVIIKAWTEERLTYRGKYTNVEDLWVLPKPAQKTPSAAVSSGKHQPGQHRFRRQPRDTGNRRRPHRHPGPSPAGDPTVARKDGAVRPPPRPPGPANVQVHLRSPHDGGSGTRPDRAGGFFLAHPPLRRRQWRPHRDADGPARQHRQRLRTLGQPPARP